MPSSRGGGRLAEPAHSPGDLLTWFVDQLGRAAHWLAARVQPTVDERGAVMLLVGGLAMLALVIGMLLVRLIVNEAAPPRVTQPRPRRVLVDVPAPPPAAERAATAATVDRGSPDDVFRRGRGVGQSFAGDTLDATLDRVAASGAGAPRLLRLLQGRAVVRLHACQGCAGPGQEGCPFEAGLLEGAFAGLWGKGTVVREVACGGPASQVCEFEVRA
ncbi:MAG TPA: 4-vinyl reductase [Candidatus Thermoplasmatota archaeon]|jgi:hypothetical protein|nr:4-vinyl reductase [Candidatus Thermoplasmatota archaeon]